MKKIDCLLLLATLLAVGQPVLSKGAADSVQNVSLLELIVAPEKFDGKKLSTIGFLDMSLDGDLLYLHEEDSTNWISNNAIWIRRPEGGRNKAVLNRKYVKVTGLFKCKYKEQLGYPLGGFYEIGSITLWSDPASPVGRKKIPGMNAEP